MTPVKTVHARIIDKHIDLIWHSGQTRVDGAVMPPTSDCCLTFELEDHNKLDLIVSFEKDAEQNKKGL